MYDDMDSFIDLFGGVEGFWARLWFVVTLFVRRFFLGWLEVNTRLFRLAQKIDSLHKRIEEIERIHNDCQSCYLKAESEEGERDVKND